MYTDTSLPFQSKSLQNAGSLHHSNIFYQLKRVSSVLWPLVFPNSFLCFVHTVPAEFHPQGALRLRTILCWTSETYLCQWSKDWTSKLAGTSGSISFCLVILNCVILCWTAFTNLRKQIFLSPVVEMNCARGLKTNCLSLYSFLRFLMGFLAVPLT